MATVMNHHYHTAVPRTIPQKVCIGLGVAFILIGFAGMVMPGFMGMHLSVAHNLVHLGSGALALWCGFSDSSKNAFNFCVGFGVVYGLLGLAGYIIGQPGYPSVGHMEADQNLLRVIPNVLEFGSSDHNVHLILAAVFLFTAYKWKRSTRHVDRSLYGRSERVNERNLYTVVPNSESDLADANLGTSDVNHIQDIKRRTEFENRL